MRVLYQVLEAGPPVLQQCVEDDGGGPAAVGLAVHQALEQHEHQGGQLLLRETLAHHLDPPRTNTQPEAVNIHMKHRALSSLSSVTQCLSLIISSNICACRLVPSSLTFRLFIWIEFV